MSSILVPIDFTTDSELALMIALGIARDRGCELILLYVIRPDDCLKDDLDDGEVKHDSEVYQTCWNRYLRYRTMTNGVSTSFQLKVGHPADVIPDVAQKECCELIVIASHQKGHLQRQMYGSVVESLGQRSVSPVVCLHPCPFGDNQKSILDDLREKLETV